MRSSTLSSPNRLQFESIQDVKKSLVTQAKRSRSSTSCGIRLTCDPYNLNHHNYHCHSCSDMHQQPHDHHHGHSISTATMFHAHTTTFTATTFLNFQPLPDPTAAAPADYQCLQLAPLPFDRFYDLVGRDSSCSSYNHITTGQSQREGQLLLRKSREIT